MSPTAEVRFWKNVKKTESCWIWTGSKVFGYGQLSVYGRGKANIRAHRLSWLLHHGVIPVGLCVLHHCDNPTCVNPAHLFLGTLKDNSRDMFTKQRCSLQRYPELYQPRGKKLTSEDVRNILMDMRSTHVELARRYGVTAVLIGQIRRGQVWRCV